MSDLLKNLLDQPSFQTHIAMALVEAGADVETKSTSGETLLHRLVSFHTPIREHNRRAIIELIKRYNATVHCQNASYKTPLECLISQKNWATRDALLLVALAAPDAENISKNVRDNNGQPLIHNLVNYDVNGISHQNRAAINDLVNKYNFDINAVDNQGNTALQCLLNKRPFSIEDALLLASLGANPNATDSYGRPLLHCLVNGIKTFSPDVTKVIIKLVNDHGFDINGLDKQGNTVLQNLMNKKNWYAKDALLLVSLGASPETLDAKGKPLAHYLVNSGTEGISHYRRAALKKCNFDVKVTDKQGHTTLQCLLNQPEGFRAEDAMFLVRLGANPNDKSITGDTLLHLLAKSSLDNSAAIKELLTKYSIVDIQLKNKQDNTALAVGVEALIRKAGNSANVNTLMNYCNDFQEAIKHQVKNEADGFTKINGLFLSAHTSHGSKSYELQGKIRGAAFEAFKDSLATLTNEEKLEKLEWAQKQRIFSKHRSHFFLATLGQTNTMISINKMISEIRSQQTETPATPGYPS